MQVINHKRVFMSNGSPLTDPDPALSPAAIKDFYSAMYPDLLNAEIQGPEVKDGELVFTFHRTTGTKGRKAKPAALAAKDNTASFLQRLEIAAGEAKKSTNLPALEVTRLRATLTPSFGDQALHLPMLNCPLLV